MNSPKAKLTEGSVGRHLVNMTVPILFGITMMMAQSIIDAWFLGKVGDRARWPHSVLAFRSSWSLRVSRLVSVPAPHRLSLVRLGQATIVAPGDWQPTACCCRS